MTLGAAKGEKLKLRAISENKENIEEESKLLEELRQMIEVDKFFEKQFWHLENIIMPFEFGYLNCFSIFKLYSNLFKIKLLKII